MMKMIVGAPLRSMVDTCCDTILIAMVGGLTGVLRRSFTGLGVCWIDYYRERVLRLVGRALHRLGS